MPLRVIEARFARRAHIKPGLGRDQTLSLAVYAKRRQGKLSEATRIYIIYHGNPIRGRHRIAWQKENATSRKRKRISFSLRHG